MIKIKDKFLKQSFISGFECCSRFSLNKDTEAVNYLSHELMEKLSFMEKELYQHSIILNIIYPFPESEITFFFNVPTCFIYEMKEIIEQILVETLSNDVEIFLDLIKEVESRLLGLLQNPVFYEELKEWYKITYCKGENAPDGQILL